MDDKIRQNLLDAGCTEEFIEKYAGLPTSCDRLMTLKTYRKQLLQQIHDEQKQLQALDYLIFNVREEVNKDCHCGF